MATDCVQYKVDINPCSDTFNQYRLFDVPCPSVLDLENNQSPIGNDYILYVKNLVNQSFTIEIISQSTQKIIITIDVEPKANEIYLNEGVYRLCFYSKTGSNYVLKQLGSNQLIYTNSCRDNINVNQNYNYTIDYLQTT